MLRLAVAALLRVVMRRAGVGPCISTFAASVLLLFGSGAFDIEFPLPAARLLPRSFVVICRVVGPE